MKATKFLLIGLCVVIILNIFLLFEVFKPGKDHPPHPPQLSKVLGMNGKDAQWVDAEFDRHIHEKDRLIEEQKKWRMLVKIDPQYAAQNQVIFAKISRLQFKIDSCTFDHFTKVKAKCNKKQVIALKQVIERMITMAGKPKQHNRP
jgi:hypothetical protein